MLFMCTECPTKYSRILRLYLTIEPSWLPLSIKLSVLAAKQQKNDVYYESLPTG